MCSNAGAPKSESNSRLKRFLGTSVMQGERKAKVLCMQARDRYTLSIPILKYRCSVVRTLSRMNAHGIAKHVVLPVTTNQLWHSQYWRCTSNIRPSVPQISIDYSTVRLTHAAW